MDNFTHSMAGWVLGQAGLKRKTRKGLAALILGANMPDIDVFFGWVSWAPLATHRGFTHGLIGGCLVLPPILAALLYLLDRWQGARIADGRAAPFKSGLEMHCGWLLALSYLGAFTHPILDLQTSYAVQLLSPFSNKWFHEESLFIIDVWLWSGLAFALWLSRRREKRGGDWRRPAMIAIAASLLYIGGNWGLSAYAKAQVAAHPPYRTPEVIFAQHEPVKFWTRGLIYRNAGQIAEAHWTPFVGYTPAKGTVADQMADPIVRRAMVANADIIDFMRWSVLPMAQVTVRGCDATVAFHDARFGVQAASARFVRTVTVNSGAPGCPPPVPSAR